MKRTRKGEISTAEVRKALQEVARGERVRSHPPLLFLARKLAGCLTRVLQEYDALDPEDVSWMDQELAEADEAETSHVRVRIASSTNTSKAQPRAQPGDADVDVVLVRSLPVTELVTQPDRLGTQTHRIGHTRPRTSDKTLHTHNA
jgi:hypothetical protein